MKNDNNFSTKTKRYSLAGVLLILGTFLIQFESIGSQFITVLAIVMAAILFFKPGLLSRNTKGVTTGKVDSGKKTYTDLRQ